MLIHAERFIYLILIVMIVAGCSTKSIISNTADQPNAREKLNGVFNQQPSDQELFEEALSYLSNDTKEPNYNLAKSRLEDLVARYPGSKWVAATRALLSSLDRISALQSQLKQERQKIYGDNAKLTKEIEGLRENAKQIEDKSSAEIVRLQQENEQLRRDIQQLKNLEIQLEKREKMLR